ncbi:MAG TPA: DUF4280 domain-containing protein [Nocardioidaceae bacterium]|jgi:hypothetical protein|nr:DUF4280 domain-containing protein [Nocardioidaceae bacterium]
MPNNVVMGAQVMCSFGAAPTALNVLPMSNVLIEGRPAATIMDFAPAVNLPTFGMCSCPANPVVAAATAAAAGVLTPQPCMPATVAPWRPGAAKTLIGGKPALTAGSTTNCAYGGVISLVMPGAMTTMSQ